MTKIRYRDRYRYGIYLNDYVAQDRKYGAPIENRTHYVLLI